MERRGLSPRRASPSSPTRGRDAAPRRTLHVEGRGVPSQLGEIRSNWGEITRVRLATPGVAPPNTVDSQANPLRGASSDRLAKRVGQPVRRGRFARGRTLGGRFTSDISPAEAMERRGLSPHRASPSSPDPGTPHRTPSCVPSTVGRGASVAIRRNTEPLRRNYPSPGGHAPRVEAERVGFFSESASRRFERPAG